MPFRLALRNLWRNTRRTLLTVAGIALAIATMLTSMSLENGAWNHMITSAIQSVAGHVVVQAEGWQEERESGQYLERSTAVAEALREAYPEATVVRRTMIGGLATSPTGSSAITLQGVEPEREAEITLLDDKLAEGRWLDDDRAIVIGRTLADTLDVGLGDKVVFMAQAGTDEVQSRLFRVRGIYQTGSDQLDGFAAFGTVAASQELLQADDPAHQIAVVFPAIGKGQLDTGPAEQAVAERDDVEVLAWNEALPLLEEQQALDAQFSQILYGFMGLIVAVGVLNTVLMGVMERIREFGVMLAVGMRPRALAVMVVVEGALLGALGGTAGVLLSLAPIRYLQVYGLDYGDMLASNSPVAGVPIDSVLRAQPDVGQMVGLGGLAVVAALLAALYPARRATALEPVDAIRHT